MLIHLIADYGINDPAFAEVSQRLWKICPSAQIQCLSVPAFSTLATGFWIAQLGLNSGPTDRLIYHNCAPRQDKKEARIDNEGEGLTYVQLPNGVKIIGVWAGYSLSFLKDSALSIRDINVSRGGSQFRSRDVFPSAVASILDGQTTLLGDEIDRDRIPDPPKDRVVWSDGYGNIKTSIAANSIKLPPKSHVTVRVGDVVSDALYTDGTFEVPEGTLAFAPGSSGWTRKDGTKVRWMELFLRGGNASKRFNQPRVNQMISYQQR